MLSDNRENYKIGSVTKDDIPLDEIPKLLSFFEEVLLELTYDRVHEDAITQRFVQLALSKQHPLLRWIVIKDNENSDGYQEDIAVSSQNNPYNEFFVLEAKRLDNTLPKIREKEYVIGRFNKDKYIESGGIERFKKEIHGKKFIHAGMIGYILTDDFASWEIKINSFIDSEIASSTSNDLKWYQSDKLTKLSENKKFAKYNSNHECISGKRINLDHLWIVL